MEQNETKKYTDITILKLWRKGRFISFSLWPEGNKIAIDIGEFDDSNRLLNNTKCYVDPLPFYTYLQAEASGTLATLYPRYDTEGFSVFGGAGAVARVFKSHWWSGRDGVDKTSRVFKCGHFEAKPNSRQGEIVPDMSKQISLSSIKMNVFELAEVYNAMTALMITRPGMFLKDTGARDE